MSWYRFFLLIVSGLLCFVSGVVFAGFLTIGGTMAMDGASPNKIALLFLIAIVMMRLFSWITIIRNMRHSHYFINQIPDTVPSYIKTHLYSAIQNNGYITINEFLDHISLYYKIEKTNQSLEDNVEAKNREEALAQLLNEINNQEYNGVLYGKELAKKANTHLQSKKLSAVLYFALVLAGVDKSKLTLYQM